jgi:uncharacterized protein
MKIVVFLISLTFIFLINSQSYYEKPEPFQYLNLFLKNPQIFLSDTNCQKLERRLKNLSSQRKGEIIVVAVEDIGKDEAWNVATQIGQKWGIGEKEKDNGVVILIRPFGPLGKRFVHIAVGYGIEENLTDATTSKIVHKIMIPKFRDRFYFNGINEGLDAIAIQLGMKDEYTKTNSNTLLAEKRHDPFEIIMAIIISILFLIGLGFLFSIISKWLGNIKTSSERTSTTYSSGTSSSRNQSYTSSSRSGGGRFGGGGACGNW